MARKDYVLMIGLIVLSGLIGGSLTSWLVSGTVIAGNSIEPPPRVLQTEKLQIVDADGNVRIELSVKPLEDPGKSERLGIYDVHGEQLQLPAYAAARLGYASRPRFQPKPRIQITDSMGRAIWSVPTYKQGMLLQ